MNMAAKAIEKLVNPPRMSDPDRLRAAVSGKTNNRRIHLAKPLFR